MHIYPRMLYTLLHKSSWRGKNTHVYTGKPTPYRFRVRATRYGAGKGLFTEDFIKKGSFVIEYIGKKLPNAIADELGTRYLFDTENGFTIDGSVKWNTARWINHACDPNVEAELDEEVGRVFINATRDILPGEELTIDYGEDYFNDFIRGVGCKCVGCTKERATTK